MFLGVRLLWSLSLCSENLVRKGTLSIQWQCDEYTFNCESSIYFDHKKHENFFNDTQGKTACFGSTGKEKPARPPLFFFFSGNSQWRGLGKWMVSLRNEQRSLRWRERGEKFEGKQKMLLLERLREWNQGDIYFSLSGKLFQQEQHETSWNVFKLSLLIGEHYITCALWTLATHNLQKDTARSNALSCLLKKKIKSESSVKQANLSLHFPHSLHQQKPGFHHRLISESFYHFTVLPAAFW